VQDESAHCEGAAVESFVTGEIDFEARVYSLARHLNDIVQDGSLSLSTVALRLIALVQENARSGTLA
jgi:hypothetical protein